MGTCESCGRTGESVVKVQRVFLLPPEGWDGDDADLDGVATPTPGEIEWWCASCLATYPHRTVVDEDGSGGSGPS